MGKRQDFIDLYRSGKGTRQKYIDLSGNYFRRKSMQGVHDPFKPLTILDMLKSGAFSRDLRHGGIASLAHGGRIGFKKGTTRSRLQKDWKSYATLKDLLYGAPPLLQDKPDSYRGPVGAHRDAVQTAMKERFMYGEPTIEADFSILDALKNDPSLTKLKAWWGNRKAKGGLARILNL